MSDHLIPSSGPPPIRYSPAGSQAAGGALEKAKNEETQLNDLWRAYDDIDKSPDTTPDEKRLARLGKSMSIGGISSAGLLRARSAIADAIAHALPGTLATVISKVLLEATEGLEKSQDSENILWHGLNAMGNSPDLTHEEQQRVNLGLAMSSNSLSPSSIIAGRRLILSSIAASVPGPASPIIAAVMQDAVKEMTSRDGMNTLWYGLESIKKDPKTIPEVQELAAFGQAFSTSSLSAESVVKARNAIITVLAKPLTDPLPQVYAGVGIDALQGAPAKDASNIAWYCLDAISKNKTAVPGEKALAALGLSFSSSSMGVETIASSREMILNLLDKPLSEPLPVLLSKVTLEASRGAMSSKDRMNCQWYGLDAIAKCQDSDAVQVALANLGKSLSTTSMKQEAIILAGDALLKTLAAHEARAVAHTIAEAVLEAAAGVTDPKDLNNMLWYGFDVINRAPGVTEEHRRLAVRGLKAGSGASTLDNAMAKKKIMEEMALSRDSLQEVRDMAEKLAQAGEPSAVEVEDGFVAIDGLKLEIRKESESPA